MAHPDIQVQPGLEFAPLFLTDEEGRYILTTLAKATYDISPQGGLVPADVPLPINYAGETWGDPERSSYKYEPEAAFTKLATDVVLIGHAHSPQGGASVVNVGLRVGPVQKIVRVFGDRYWVKQRGEIVATPPRPFERMPLTYERAFGGFDEGASSQSKPSFEPRNPIGRGFGDSLPRLDDEPLPLPNLEDPAALIRRYGDRPAPAAFGFVSPNWQPRVRYAGTYDAAWERDRKPLLPEDFDRRFFNAASPGLVAPGYLTGNEEVVVVNAAPVPQLRFVLPALPPPTCDVRFKRRSAERLQTSLDTVIVNTDENVVLLLWRAYTVVPGGPHDVLAIDVKTA